MSCSTRRTAALATVSWRRPRAVSSVGRARGGCLCWADDESLAFEGLQEHVHRLPGDEGAAGKLGVGQARSLGEQLQAGVVGDRHAERSQHGLQGRVQGARGRLQHVPQRCVQLDSGLALTHVSSLTYIGVCQKTDIP